MNYFDTLEATKVLVMFFAMAYACASSLSAVRKVLSLRNVLTALFVFSSWAYVSVFILVTIDGKAPYLYLPMAIGLSIGSLTLCMINRVMDSRKSRFTKISNCTTYTHWCG